jgi:hypothetical protein
MSGKTPEDEGFLGRWSRRKRAAAEAEPRPAPLVPPVELPAEAPVPAVENQADSEPPQELEPVEPPSLDLIDKDFQLAPWLKQNVPEAWKLAAMRRAWENDPAIAGFENPARDYALDWNTPGGAPGYGPLNESDDVAEMVRGIFGEPPPEKPGLTQEEAVGDGMSHQLSSDDENDGIDAAAQEPEPSGDRLVAIRRSDESAPASDSSDQQGMEVQPIYAAAQQNDDPRDVSVRTRKRGGGAIPI